MPDAASDRSLVVEVEVEIRTTQKIDLIVYYKNLPEHERSDYWVLDIAEVGYDEEWERPVAFIHPTEADGGFIHAFSVSGSGAEDSGWVDFECEGARVRQRPVGWMNATGYRWTEQDFHVLCAAVPWLLPPDSDITPEDLARLPGPLDTPMFEAP